MTKHSVIIEMTAQSGKRDEVIALWKEALAAADTENGDIAELVVALDDGDADTMRLIEFYGESAGFDRVMESAEVGAFVQGVTPMLAAPPNIIRSTPVWAKTMNLD